MRLAQSLYFAVVTSALKLIEKSVPDVHVVRRKLRSSFAPHKPDSSPSLQIDNKLKAAGLFDRYAMSLAGGD
jgi:hypothetical protein